MLLLEKMLSSAPVRDDNSYTIVISSAKRERSLDDLVNKNSVMLPVPLRLAMIKDIDLITMSKHHVLS